MAEERLGPSAPHEVTERLRTLVGSRATREIDPRELAAGGSDQLDVLTAALEALAREGGVTAVPKWTCPETGCGLPLSEDDVQARRCPHCQADYRETGNEPSSHTVFRVEGELSRDIQWVVVVHGMNTLGPWQEELSWRLGNTFRYSAPVLIYKYGLIRVGVLFRFRHRQLVEALGKRLQRAVAFARDAGRARAPDVVLHSFGTLLFAKLLKDPRFADLRFGRVVLAGSIVRPDYDWSAQIAAGRVEAVLNHCGDRDWVVGLAGPTIPDTGASGRIGLRDCAVHNVAAPGYGHGTFFEARGLDECLADEGLWDRFFRLPLANFQAEHMPVPRAARWRPLPSLVQRLTAAVVVLIIALAVVLTVAAFASLAFDVWRFMAGRGGT